MDFEKLLDDLRNLDPYKLQILRDQLDAHNERKMINMILRYAVAGFGIMVYLLTHR